MSNRLFPGGMLLKITLATALVSLYFSGITQGTLSTALAAFGFIAIMTFLVIVLLGLLTRD